MRVSSTEHPAIFVDDGDDGDGGDGGGTGPPSKLSCVSFAAALSRWLRAAHRAADGIDVSSPNIYGSDFRTMARGLTWHHGAAYVTVNPTRHGGREINFVEIQLTTFRNLDIYECCTHLCSFIVLLLALMIVVVTVCQPQTTEATSPLTASHRTLVVCLLCCVIAC